MENLSPFRLEIKKCRDDEIPMYVAENWLLPNVLARPYPCLYTNSFLEDLWQVHLRKWWL